MSESPLVGWMKGTIRLAADLELTEPDIIVGAVNIACAMAFISGLAVDDLYSLFEREWLSTVKSMGEEEEMFEDALDSEGLRSTLRQMVQGGQPVVCLSDDNLRLFVALGVIALVSTVERALPPVLSPDEDEGDAPAQDDVQGG